MSPVTLQRQGSTFAAETGQARREPSALFSRSGLEFRCSRGAIIGSDQKLLSVLEERQFERVGSSAPIKADVRLIAATNKNLLEKVSRGELWKTSALEGIP